MIVRPVRQLMHASALLDETTAAQLDKEISDKLIPYLSAEAAKLPLQLDDELAIDWFNGRRTPDANQFLTGSLHGLNLGTDAPAIFKSLVEATCFGAKMIVDRFINEGVPVKGLIGLGGVAKRSPYIMQVMANIMNMPIRIHKSEQTCALGAAMFAATAAGVYGKVEEAMEHMGQGFDAVYTPDATIVPYYQQRYIQYQQAGAYTESKAPKQ